MPILDASHDFAHEVEGDSAWSESYYFNAYDPGADAGLFTRIGVRPTRGPSTSACPCGCPATAWRTCGACASSGS